jgi:hypothetical protein
MQLSDLHFINECSAATLKHCLGAFACLEGVDTRGCAGLRRMKPGLNTEGSNRIMPYHTVIRDSDCL